MELNPKECLEQIELKSCDRCLQRCTRVFWNSSESLKHDKKGEKFEFSDEKPSTSSEHFITAGQLLDTGPCGSSVFKLSKQVAKAPPLVPKRRYHVLNRSLTAIQTIEQELEMIRSVLLPLLVQKIDNRQEGVLQGNSDEFKDAIDSISNKYRDRRAEVNSNCFSQMENLRRQLHADVEFEEKIAKQKTNEALIKRLKEVEGKLEALGCVGPDFSIPTSKIHMQNSTLCRIEFDNKFATSMLPIPNRLVKAVKDAERDELQNFLLYAHMANRVNDADEMPLKKRFKIEQVESSINGLIELEEDDDENE